MNHFKTYTFLNIVVFSLLFLLCSFYEVGFNIGNWQEGTRLCVAIIQGVAQIPIFALTLTILEDNKNDK